jgi:hypothetical protein
MTDWRCFVVNGHGETTIRYRGQGDGDPAAGLTPAQRRDYDALMADSMRRADDAYRAAYAAGLRGDYGGLDSDEDDEDTAD